MTNKISIPLSEMDENFLKELKEKYPDHSRLDIQVVSLEDIPSFSEDDFWEIIDLLDWSTKGSRNEVLEPAIVALAEGPISNIYLFEDQLAEKLFHLDTKAHAKAAYPDQRFSEDGFLYVRAAIVASGKNNYKKVLTHPSHLSGAQDFEPLLSLAALAYERKTQANFDYLPPTNYETYSNAAGWE